MRDLAIAALVPSANDAATALAVHVGRGSVERFVAMMNPKARSLGLTVDALREPARPRPDRPRFERARPHDVALRGPAEPVHPHVVDEVDRDDCRRPGAHLDRRADREAAARSAPRPVIRTPRAGRRSQRSSAAACGSPPSLLGARSEEQRNAELGSLLTWGLAQYHPVRAIDEARVYGVAETGYGRPLVKLVAARTVVRNVRVGRPLVERVVAELGPARFRSPAGQRAGEVRVFAGGRLIARAPLVAADAVPAVGASGRLRWYARRTVHHLFGLVS